MDSNEIPAGAVVVGVDGSREANHAIDWAADQARNEGRDLVLLHAVGTSAATVGWMASGGVDPTDYLAETGALGAATLATAAERAHDAVRSDRIHTLVVRDDPRNALIQASGLASTVVVGSRGLGPVRGLLLGSVGAAIARHSHCPAIVVRPHHPGRVRRGVLVAVDGTEASRSVLEFAFRQASERRLPITAMHAERDPDPAPGDGSLTLAEALAGLAEKYPDVAVARMILRGSPADAILEHADEMNLVVVGHGRRGPVDRAFGGSVALGVVEHAQTVVAVVPQG